MNYLRNFNNLKVGQRVLQIAFGSGFKCNSSVWLCLHNRANRPGRRVRIEDRELEGEEVSKSLDEDMYCKRRDPPPPPNTNTPQTNNKKNM